MNTNAQSPFGTQRRGKGKPEVRSFGTGGEPIVGAGITYGPIKIVPGSKKCFDNLQNERKREITVTVTSSSPTDCANNLFWYIGVFKGDIWWVDNEIDPLCVASQADAHNDEKTPTVWTLHFVYEAHPLGFRDENNKDPTKNSQNPLTRPPEMHWEIETRQEAADTATLLGFSYATDGTTPNALNVAGQTISVPSPNYPVGNSAGDAYDRAMMVDRQRRVFAYTRNEAVFPDDNADKYFEATNSDTVLGKKPGTWICRGITGQWVYEPTGSYWRVTYRFAYDPKGWWRYLKDMGTRCWKQDANNVWQLGPASDYRGLSATAPVPLDGSGQQLTNTHIASGYFAYMVYDTPGGPQPFAALNLTGIWS